MKVNLPEVRVQVSPASDVLLLFFSTPPAPRRPFNRNSTSSTARRCPFLHCTHPPAAPDRCSSSISQVKPRARSRGQFASLIIGKISRDVASENGALSGAAARLPAGFAVARVGPIRPDECRDDGDLSNERVARYRGALSRRASIRPGSKLLRA
jgi:hypothetical protein